MSKYKIVESLKNRNNNFSHAAPVTLAFLGDSVTHGCFDDTVCDRGYNGFFDLENNYPEKLRRMINAIFPAVNINVINSGISGDTVHGGLERVERDVIAFHPDLCVVAYGLNDCCAGADKLGEFSADLRALLRKLSDSGTQTILLTQNVMTKMTNGLPRRADQADLARAFSGIQNAGVMDSYVEEERKIAAEYGVSVADCYAMWNKLAAQGVNTDGLLVNNLNHPNRDMHFLFAASLFYEIFLA